MEARYNTRSPAVKRLMKEAAELATATPDYQAAPLEENLFEWHFTVRGPGDTDFQGGVYHGRILVPTDYPMKPPDIIVNTPNGRFEVGKKICLSISGHHPETWQPSWSIRTALLAIIGFMPSPAQGTIGSLDYTPEERRALARRSASWSCPSCGPAASLLAPEDQGQGGQGGHRQEVEEIVKTLQIKGEEEVKKEMKDEEDKNVKEAEAMETQHDAGAIPPVAATAASTGATNTSTASSASTTLTTSSAATMLSTSSSGASPTTGATSTTAAASSPAVISGATTTTSSATPATSATPAPPRPRRVRPPARQQESQGVQQVYDLCIVLLVAAIAALIYRRLGAIQTGDDELGGD